jgi:tRNA/tmRNA/rRNA uracil-C5-methylase (TrmA/RlmC/RlmD family)
VTPGMDVVDLCSSDGWFTLPLSRIARSVIAIDIDAALLEAAKVRITERAGGVPTNATQGTTSSITIPMADPLDPFRRQ